MSIVLAENVEEYLFCQTADSFMKRGIIPSPEVHLYLVKMLSSLNNHQIEKPISGEFLENLSEKDPVKFRKVSKELGDKCLIFLGFFYENVRKVGQDNVNLYMTVGVNAYNGLGNLLNKMKKSKGDHFLRIGEQFESLSDVISDLRLPDLEVPEQLSKLYSRWEKTRDKRYASVLKMKGLDLGTLN